MIRIGATVWLDCREACARIGRSERTLRRWIAHGDITPICGLLCEDELLEVERIKRLTNNTNRRTNLQVTSRMS